MRKDELIGCYIACGFNCFYYLKSGKISNLLGAILCLIGANEFIGDALYGINDDTIIIKGKAIARSCIQKIELKEVFIFSFLSIAIVHVRQSPQISFYISKRAWNDLKES